MCRRQSQCAGKSHIVGNPKGFLICRDCWQWVKQNSKWIRKILRQTIHWGKIEMPIKIWLDDERKAPEGWVTVRTATDCRVLLEALDVQTVSLDHDLGDDKKYGTGYDVLCWMEEQVVTRDYKPPMVYIHTDNPAGRKKMEAAWQQILKLVQQRSKKS